MLLRRAGYWVACVAAVAGCATAAERTFIRGEIHTPGGTGSVSVTMELVDLQQRAVVGRDMPGAAGTFEFDSIPEGQYELRVLNQRGDVIRSEYVTAVGTGNFVIVNLAEDKPPERPVSGTVSVATLQHKVPDKAQKEFLKSAQAMKSNDVEKSIQHLKRALEIDPDYMEAHNNLGSRYFAMNKFADAAAEFQKAVARDPGSELVQSNLALALIGMERYPEAEKAARRALELGHSRKTCLALGVSLAEQWKDASEAIEHLMHAAPEFPRAHLLIAQVLTREGQKDRADEQVKQYLAADKTADPRAVEQWLAKAGPH